MERSTTTTTTTKPSHRRGGPSNPSFSSSLLDAICRAIDESDGTCTTTTEPPSLSLTNKQLSPEPPLSPVLLRRIDDTGDLHRQFSADAYSSRPRPISTTVVPSPVLLRRIDDTGDLHPRHRRQFSTDADSYRPWPRPIRTVAAPRPPTPRPKSEPNSIRTRIWDQAARSGPSPASPGSRLASFVAGLFAGAGRTRKKAKISSGVCSPASSLAGSCFSRTPPPSSGGGKRSVEFGGGDAAAARAREGRRMVAELMKGLADEMDDGEDSDDDDDLFELQDLGELPVYETTHRAIAL